MTTNTTESKQICSITVMFPVDSDDAAIAVKKKVGEALSDIEDSRIDFRIMPVPMPGTMPMR
ncbi:hypothetical protein LCGC14_0994770 [marine sediment metagenome]|uniref:Uncharacterized protein n=1 Tax=marine sediment metagenome TaxID=412755 RepID=A0A0F9QN68_9ZZZZ